MFVEKKQAFNLFSKKNAKILFYDILCEILK